MHYHDRISYLLNQIKEMVDERKELLEAKEYDQALMYQKWIDQKWRLIETIKDFHRLSKEKD